jgi:hypothetical protein
MTQRGDEKVFWALTRNGELYSIWITRTVAREKRDSYQPGSKHKWGVEKVLVRRADGEDDKR